MQRIIETWKSFDFKTKPYVHPDDKILLRFNNDYRDFQHYIKDPNFESPEKESYFHLNLLPVPYKGDIINAKVYILALNPGFRILDYYSESSSQSVRELLIKNAKQELTNEQFPFFELNPEFLWLGSGRYWTTKLKDIISEIQNRTNKTYVDSLKFLSKNIAILELVPYHSKEFKLKTTILKSLETTKIMVDFVKSYVIKKANNGNACVIVTRKSKYWGINESKNVIIYKGSESRSAHLSKGSRGGKAIIEFLEKQF